MSLKGLVQYWQVDAQAHRGLPVEYESIEPEIQILGDSPETRRFRFQSLILRPEVTSRAKHVTSGR